MIQAAPVVRKPMKEIGAPGATDFVSIFLAQELNGDEYRTTFRHEQAHVWARHNARRPKIHCHSGEWKIACEMEIARNIYDAIDIATISSPRSRLKGAYLPDTFPDLPTQLLSAEEIYEWLLSNSQQETRSTCSCDCESEEESGSGESKPISEVRSRLDEEEAAEKSSIAAQSAYREAINRPPTLVSEIDAALRTRFVSERSFRRPSRRESSAELIQKGRMAIPRPPLVEIFVDRSGSFTAEKTRAAQEILEKILRRYGASIKKDVWFFGDRRLTADDDRSGGDTPYHLIAHHLMLSAPKLAIVITDDDPCGDLPAIPKSISVICVPIGSSKTNISLKIKGKDVIA